MAVKLESLNNFRNALEIVAELGFKGEGRGLVLFFHDNTSPPNITYMALALVPEYFEVNASERELLESYDPATSYLVVEITPVQDNAGETAELVRMVYGKGKP